MKPARIRPIMESTEDRMDSICSDRCVHTCDKTLLCMMFPWKWLVNKFLSFFKSTTGELAHRFEEPCYERYVILSCLIPVFLVLILLLSPVATIAWLIWIPVQRKRKQFIYTVQRTEPDNGQPAPFVISQNGQTPSEFQGDKIIILVENLELYPEYFSRCQNLANTQNRSRLIGQSYNDTWNKHGSLQIDTTAVHNSEIRDSYPGNTSKMDITTTEEDHLMKSGQIRRTSGALDPSNSSKVAFMTTSVGEQNSTKDGHVVKFSCMWPAIVDFVCFQGVVDARAENTIVGNLKKTHPHVIHNVRMNSWNTNHFMLNTGLVFASRYPICAAEFKEYGQDIQQNDSKITLGVLILKVCIGHGGPNNKALIVFIAITNYIHDSNVRRQNEAQRKHNHITELCSMVHNFKERYERPEETEVVAFFCGDSEFQQSFSSMSSEYGAGPIQASRFTYSQEGGKQKSTELVRYCMYKKNVLSAEDLRTTLCDPALREKFLVHIEHFEEEREPSEEQSDGNTVSDFVCPLVYSTSTDSRVSVIPDQCTLMTCLSTLSGQLPVAQSFSIVMDETG